MADAKRKIEVVPYDPKWPDLFAAEAAAIRSVLADCLVAIHHIGSTSVPGLAAKPIIDIVPEVKNLSQLDQHDAAMEELGYEIRGEYGIPGRRLYLKGTAARTHNVHAFETGSHGLKRHIAVRDYLIAHPDVAAEYGTLKKKNAEDFPDDIEAYCAAKHDYVQALEQQALAWSNLK